HRESCEPAARVEDDAFDRSCELREAFVVNPVHAVLLFVLLNEILSFSPAAGAAVRSPAAAVVEAEDRAGQDRPWVRVAGEAPRVRSSVRAKSRARGRRSPSRARYRTRRRGRTP